MDEYNHLQRDIEYQIRFDIISQNKNGIKVYFDGYSPWCYHLWIYTKGNNEAQIIRSWNLRSFRYFKSLLIAYHWEEYLYDQGRPKGWLGDYRRKPDNFNYFLFQLSSALLPYVENKSLLYAELCKEEYFIEHSNISYSERSSKRVIVARLLDKPLNRSISVNSIRTILDQTLGGYMNFSSTVQKSLPDCKTGNPVLILKIDYRELYDTSFDYEHDDEDNIMDEHYLLLKHGLTIGDYNDLSLEEIIEYDPYTNLSQTFQCDNTPSKAQLHSYTELLDSMTDYLSDYTSNRTFRKATLSIESEHGVYYKGGKAIQILTIAKDTFDN